MSSGIVWLLSLNNSDPKNLDLSATKSSSLKKEPSITKTSFLFVDFIFEDNFFLGLYRCSFFVYC